MTETIRILGYPGRQTLYKWISEKDQPQKCVYSVLGINMEGRKHILGIWTSENESASFRAGVCNDLKNRGVKDILIVCRNNLSGFSTAIAAAFPQAEQQLCVTHQIRNSTKYVSFKDIKKLMVDLKQVYTAPSPEDAEYRLEEFRDKWDKKYSQILRSWEANWAELSTYFKYPPEIRRLIYTTNAGRLSPYATEIHENQGRLPQ